jgi:hypothetical protein
MENRERQGGIAVQTPNARAAKVLLSCRIGNRSKSA